MIILCVLFRKYSFVPKRPQVCLFACEQNNSKSCGRIWTKFCGELGYVTRTTLLDFSEDPNLDLDLRNFKAILHLRVMGRKRHIARYLEKLWTDSDESWWAGWACYKEELIPFWWRSESGSENYFKRFFTNWEIWLNRYIEQYLEKLWTDSDETW